MESGAWDDWRSLYSGAALPGQRRIAGEAPGRLPQARLSGSVVGRHYLGNGKAAALHAGSQARGSTARAVSLAQRTQAGEAYINDDFNVEGDIEAAFDLADYLLGHEGSLRESLGLNKRLQKMPANDRPQAGPRPIKLWGSVHSKDRDQQAVTYHYDLPAQFYALWLDQRMVYSCAYFVTPEEDLDPHSSASWITSARSCGSALANVSWTLAAVGAD